MCGRTGGLSLRGNETRCGSRSCRRAAQTRPSLLLLPGSPSPSAGHQHSPPGVMRLLSPHWITAEWTRKSTPDLNLRIFYFLQHRGWIFDFQKVCFTSSLIFLDYSPTEETCWCYWWSLWPCCQIQVSESFLFFIFLYIIIVYCFCCSGTSASIQKSLGFSADLTSRVFNMFLTHEATCFKKF